MNMTDDDWDDIFSSLNTNATKKNVHAMENAHQRNHVVMIQKQTYVRNVVEKERK